MMEDKMILSQLDTWFSDSTILMGTLKESAKEATDP